MDVPLVLEEDGARLRWRWPPAAEWRAKPAAGAADPTGRARMALGP
jgi:hypothetical protein